jgi:hypothetical protein
LHAPQCSQAAANGIFVVEDRRVGAVAFSRSGDPATGDFGDAKVIRKFGEFRTT